MEFGLLWLVLASTLLIIFMIIWVVYTNMKTVKSTTYIGRKIEYMETKITNNNYSSEKLMIEYSEQLLDFTRNLISQIVVLEFRKFSDKNELSKVTEGHLKSFASEVAMVVKNSINRSTLDLSYTVYTEEFYNRYIIDTCFMMIKQMFNEALEKSMEI